MSPYVARDMYNNNYAVFDVYRSTLLLKYPLCIVNRNKPAENVDIKSFCEFIFHLGRFVAIVFKIKLIFCIQGMDENDFYGWRKMYIKINTR